MSVKTKLLSEEAVLTSQTEQISPPSIPSINEHEIALVSKKPRDNKKKATAKTVTFPATVEELPAPTDKALWLKGKGGKSNPNGKGILKGKNR